MRTALSVAAAIGLAALSVPAGASADTLDVYQRLAARGLRPAPLVPTTAPRSLAPLDRTITSAPSRRRSGYALRLVKEPPGAVIVLERGTHGSLSAALREFRRQGFTARATRVRGRAARLLTRRLGPTTRFLVWVEDGEVYSLGSGTPRTDSLKDLRATATGLDHLGRDYIGAHVDPENSSEGFAVTTDRTITVRVAWEATCVAPDGSPAGIRVGNAFASMIARPGNAFAFDIAQHRILSGDWNGTVSGTISATAVTLSIDATAVIDGTTCSSGPLSIALDRRVDG